MKKLEKAEVQKAKICHLTTVHGRFDTRIFIKECMSLARNGHEVNLVVADGKGNETKNSVLVHDIGKPKNKIRRMLLTSRVLFRKAVEIDAAIYHFHDPELIFIGNRLIKMGKKVIYDSHEDLPRQIFTKPYLPKFVMKTVSFLVEKLENKMAKNFDFVIAATPHIKERFSQMNTNTEVIHNYPFLSEFDNLISSPKDKEYAACYIGGIYPVRGIYENIEALASIKQKMLLAGDFKPTEFKLKCQESEGWPYVDYVGYVDRKEMVTILAKSKAGLVTLYPTPNYLDSLPVKMFEYMAASIPVIASRFPLWQNIVEKYECGICVDPQNVEEIADAISFIISNPERAIAMGENGRNAVEKVFNWEQEEKKLIELYKDLS